MGKPEITVEDRAAIEGEVRAVTEKLITAVRQADFDRVAALVSRDDPFNLGYIDNGVFLFDFETMESRFRPGFARLQSQDMEINDMRIAILAPDVAVITWHGQISANHKDGQTFERALALTYVLVKDGGDWKFVHMHQSFPWPQTE
jgi:uncharacterized protein (TIGR02246 family)